MSMSFDGCPRSRSRTHPPTTRARPPAAAAASAMRRTVLSEASAEDTAELSFARTEEGPGSGLALCETGCATRGRRYPFLMLDRMTTTPPGGDRQAAAAPPVRIRRCWAVLSRTERPTLVSRIRRTCTAARCAPVRNAAAHRARGDHRGTAEPFR